MVAGMSPRRVKYGLLVENEGNLSERLTIGRDTAIRAGRSISFRGEGYANRHWRCILVHGKRLEASHDG